MKGKLKIEKAAITATCENGEQIVFDNMSIAMCNVWVWLHKRCSEVVIEGSDDTLYRCEAGWTTEKP